MSGAETLADPVHAEPCFAGSNSDAATGALRLARCAVHPSHRSGPGLLPFMVLFDFFVLFDFCWWLASTVVAIVRVPP